MTLNECCDEIARLRGWTYSAHPWSRDEPVWHKRQGEGDDLLTARHPISELEDLVDNWPNGWQTAGHQTKIGDKPAVWGGVATRRNGQGQMLTVSGHASMFEAEAFLLLKVLQGEDQADTPLMG